MPRDYVSSSEDNVSIAKQPVSNISTNTSTSPSIVSSAKLRQLEKMDDYYDKQVELYRASVNDTVKSDTVITASLVASTPPAPITPTPPPPLPAVKSATPQYIIFDQETTPIEIMTDLIFENIGGQELLEITRHDTITGDFIPSQLIKNIGRLNQVYDPKNIINLQNTSDRYFSNFSIKLNNKIPNVGNGTNGSNIYIEEDTGDIIIELIDMAVDEQVEVQISIDGTIYEVVL